MNAVQCGKAITGLMTSMSDLRDNESSRDEMWKAIQTQCESQGIELQDNKRKRKIREILDMLRQVDLFLPVACVLCLSSEQFLVCETIKPLLSVYAETCGISEALPNAGIAVAMNMLKENLGDDLPKVIFTSSLSYCYHH